METTETPKRPKSAAGNVKTTPVRVSKETRRRILLDLARLNKKEHGRRIKPEDLIALALTLLEPRHYLQLVESTLSNADRLERRYLDYVKKHGHITKDAFLGSLLSGGHDAPSEKGQMARESIKPIQSDDP